MLLATGLALFAAVLHAGWNLAVKQSGDRLLTTWAMFSWGAIVCVPLLLLVGMPGWQVVPYLAGSAVVHGFYVWMLTRAYDLGDFSVAYPIARGGGALIAAVGGILFLNDELSLLAGIGGCIAVAGLMSLARLRTSGPALFAALATAVTIGTYTLIDSTGAREANGAGYGLATSIVSTLGVTVLGVVRGKTPVLLPAMKSRRIAIGGIASAAAYTAVLIAVRHAPVGYVACLRESSVVLGAVGGWWLLKEPMARGRIVSACIVAAGVAVLVVGG